MANSSRFVRTVLLAAFSLLFFFGLAAPSFATGNIVKSDLKGTWRISLRGLTDCGFATALATITLGTNGSGTGPLQIHGDCGDSTLPGQTFTVDTLSKTGEGTASLTCGGGCTWNFEIQVAPDRTKFNLTIVEPLDDFLEGLAILSSPADNIAVADLKGDWQVSLMGHQAPDCTVSAAGALTLNTAGVGTLSATLHSDCFDGPVVNSFAISTLSADGGGTAHLDCGGGCELDFNIQVSPDRSMFNLVTIAPGNAGDMAAGVAIRRSTAGHITKTNLAGPWQGTLQGIGADGGIGDLVLTFKLNAKATSSAVTMVYHDLEGDGTVPDNTFTVLTLNPDGSGTARFSDDVNLRIQVSPDRSVISLTGVDPASEDFIAGLFIHQ
jgi:hypothetical protein